MGGPQKTATLNPLPEGLDPDGRAPTRAAEPSTLDQGDLPHSEAHEFPRRGAAPTGPDHD